MRFFLKKEREKIRT